MKDSLLFKLADAAFHKFDLGSLGLSSEAESAVRAALLDVAVDAGLRCSVDSSYRAALADVCSATE